MIDNKDLEQVCKPLYDLNKRFKIEYDDLLQQAWVIYLELQQENQKLSKQEELKLISNRLSRFIHQERKNPLSDAINIDLVYSKHEIKDF